MVEHGCRSKYGLRLTGEKTAYHGQGTVVMSFIILFSASLVRNMAYEVFLILHIVLSVVFVVTMF